ncbi:Zn(2+)-responsive transcriptional regulator [Oceanospirillum sp. D5]|uniref:Zn(2+)-responsive transcriptional regulator n=2 Tax=Oceanospirillum sediminis TaxID=2760088 RepID=A0A839ILJ6_9GAMM|nr:Zn(2+)-responsive transcriptional regulator [Oceanospirillum sediminis]
MRIGELASKTGISVEALRFYEKQGLLKTPHRSDAGYRLYDEKTLKQVSFILKAKAVGFSLKDIAGLLALEVNREQETCESVKNFAQSKLDEINAKLAELQRMKDALQQITDACCGSEKSAVHCTILTALSEDEGEPEHH